MNTKTPNEVRSSEREWAVSFRVKYERHRRLAPVADLVGRPQKMKPLQRLSSQPAFSVIAHEVGHLLVGLELGLHEGGIEFAAVTCDELARAHFNATGATNRNRIVRGLAGMYLQAQTAPESIPDKLRTSILGGSLFQERVSMIKSMQVPADVVANGFKGDWIYIISLASTQPQREKVNLQILENSLTQLREMVIARGLKRKADVLIADVQCWLMTDDADIAVSPLIIYPIGRARSIVTGPRAQPGAASNGDPTTTTDNLESRKSRHR